MVVRRVPEPSLRQVAELKRPLLSRILEHKVLQKTHGLKFKTREAGSWESKEEGLVSGSVDWQRAAPWG